MRMRLSALLCCSMVSSGAFAQATAQGVALSAYSDCDSPAGLDLTMNNGPIVTTETGLVTDDTGATLMSFSQATGFANFVGTFPGYNFSSPAWSVPSGTRVALYATIGVIPPTPADTAEWFILYRCNTGEVLVSCFGQFGTCPETALEALGGQSIVEIPTLSPAGVGLMIFALAALGAALLVRRRAS